MGRTDRQPQPARASPSTFPVLCEKTTGVKVECVFSVLCLCCFGFPGVEEESWNDQGDGWSVRSPLVFSSCLQNHLWPFGTHLLVRWVRLRSRGAELIGI